MIRPSPALLSVSAALIASKPRSHRSHISEGARHISDTSNHAPSLSLALSSAPSCQQCHRRFIRPIWSSTPSPAKSRSTVTSCKDLTPQPGPNPLPTNSDASPKVLAPACLPVPKPSGSSESTKPQSYLRTNRCHDPPTEIQTSLHPANRWRRPPRLPRRSQHTYRQAYHGQMPPQQYNLHP
jgi:hypothetical protein